MTNLININMLISIKLIKKNFWDNKKISSIIINYKFYIKNYCDFVFSKIKFTEIYKKYIIIFNEIIE